MTLRLALMLGDGVTAVLVFLLVSVIRFGNTGWTGIWSRMGIDIRVAAIVFGIGWVVALWYHGLYRLRARWRLRTEAKDIARSTLLVAALTLSILFLFKQQDVSRIFLLSLFTAEPLVTLAIRGSLRLAFSQLRRRGLNARYMLVVGTGRLAQDFADLVEARPGLGISVIGHLSLPGEENLPSRARSWERSTRSSGSSTPTSSTRSPPASPSWPATWSRSPAWPLTRGRRSASRSTRTRALLNAREEEFEGLLIRSLVHDGQREVGLAIKRVMDILGAALGLVILSPLMLGTALAIRLRDGSPVLFRQTRVGLHGRPFTIVKFRTMDPDAEERLHEVAHLNERDGAAFKATDDPRMSRLGRTLRRTSLDELPQLWNVLKGEMSLVGPRPPLPAEVVEYDIWHRRRLSMKPGITGLWQVEMREEPSFDRWVELDLSYIDRWTLWLDLRILLRTMPSVLMARGR